MIGLAFLLFVLVQLVPLQVFSNCALCRKIVEVDLLTNPLSYLTCSCLHRQLMPASAMPLFEVLTI